MRIYLTGFMACGKSTFGPKLAKSMSFNFVDTDALIEKETGKSISEIFSEMGEAGFRKLETKILHSTLLLEKYVISTGGGMPCFNNNMDLMNTAGNTVFLYAPFGGIWKRLQDAKTNRPLFENLLEAERKDFLQELYDQRLPFYFQSKVVVDPLKVKAGDLKKWL